jgi:hypothetical protein
MARWRIRCRHGVEESSRRRDGETARNCRGDARVARNQTGEQVVDIIMVAAFVAFFAMVLGWLAAPAGVTRPASTVVEPSTLIAGEAQA